MQNNIVQHLLFWTLYLSLYTYYAYVWGGQFMYAFLSYLITLPLVMLCVYCVVYSFIPRFLFNARRFHFFTWSIFVIILTAIGVRLIHNFLLGSVYENIWDTMNWKGHGVLIFNTIFELLYFTTFAVSISLLKNWYLKDRELKEQKQYQLEAELKLLKAQVNPHFLFNTLNNLYTLTLTQSKQAPTIVEKLSGLLHYMNYDTDTSSVFLQKELNYIENYLSLEKIRYDEKLEIAFTVNGAIQSQKIAPLLLLPFVENAFKHSISQTIEKAWINIHILLEKHQLILKIENSKTKEPKKNKNAPPGIGLKNVKRRLQLLYPNAHQLDIYDEEDSFLVILHLNLQS